MSNQPPQRKGEPSRINITAHQRVMADPHVADLAKELRNRWKVLNMVERGDRLTHLELLGCSRRGLADYLHIADITVRRSIEIAGSSERTRQAVISGASAKSILEKKAATKRRQQSDMRLLQERETGEHSDEIADLIIVFCQANDRVRRTKILPNELETFLNQAEVHLRDLSRRGASRARTSKRAGVEGLLKRTRPEENPDEHWMERHANWLASAMRAIVPEPEIWERGLHKARGRRQELKEEKTPLQMHSDGIKRRQAIQNPYQRRRRF